ncbi:binder of sperm protein homolog 1 [Macaca nemestrina]|uniref:binder of sperm protein homolog 1 n=1 Tax=Macaca nemestrina TaxID=9545 RepID=UPI0039B8D359
MARHMGLLLVWVCLFRGVVGGVVGGLFNILEEGFGAEGLPANRSFDVNKAKALLLSGTITFTAVTANDSDFKGQQPLGRQWLDNLSLNTPGNRGRILFSLDGECVFPFHYKNGTYYDCIRSKSRHKWCSLNETYEGYWKYCSAEDFASCVFPFWYRRLIYWDCTDHGEAFGKKWCSLTKNFNKDRIWKYCE